MTQSLEVPEYTNFATDVIDRFAAECPDALALLWVDAAGEREERLSFAELAEESRRVAAGLQALGLRPGDRVKIVVGREPAWWVCMLAALRAGLVSIPGTTLLTPKDFDQRIARAGAVGVIADAANASKVDEIRAKHPGLRACVVTTGAREGWTSLDTLGTDAPFEPVRTRADDTCMIYFTSGTTGAPKMVVHTHASYPIGHRTTGGYWLGVGPGDLHWNMSDTGWAKAAYSSLFGPWSQGAGVFVQEATPRFDAGAMLETLRRFPITSFCSAPTAFRQLIAEPSLAEHPPRGLRRVQAAGEPLNPEVWHAWKAATGIEIHEGYGQTETVILVCNHESFPVKPGSMGRAAPGFDVEVLTDALEPAADMTEGEIAVRVAPERPVGLFVEYEANPEENAEKFRGDWYLTGDRGYRDADGYFWFIGRSDDVILSAGYRIGPFEVESALIEHPAVLEAAVVGAPDPERYQIVKAFVTLHEGQVGSPELARELQDHVKRTTAPYKYPREVVFVDELPKTVSGKIRRVELRGA
jgi:acetyl-CoA synthetase/medium-chain acyl-CoA synthetase